MSEEPHYDVIVVGLGPVGSLLTLLLGHQGLRVAAIERDHEVYKLPRAVNLDGEIVRAMQPVGLADELDALLQKNRPDERAGFVDSKHNWLFGQGVRDSGPSGWQSMNFFDQPQVEQFLRDHALSAETVDAFIGYTADALSQDESGVQITARNDDASTTIKGRYLVACDGASSSIRSALNIAWQDLGYDQDWLVVDVETRPGHTLGTTTMQVCDPDRISTYVCTKDPYRRWEFRLNPGETREEMLRPETIHKLVNEWTPPGTYSIRRSAVYQFHAATAATWRNGRVFIAGDAAHQTPPFLGQGMNTGMRDAANLAWKLPMVVRGIAGEKLLDTYEAERKAHAQDLSQWAVAIGQLMEHLAAVEQATRAGHTPPDMPEALKKSGYGQGREQPPLRDGVVVLAQVGEDGISGVPAYQPNVRVNGTSCRLDDLLGPGFAILSSAGDGHNLTPENQALIDLLDVAVIKTSELTVTEGRLLGESHDAVVVRPDRYIFGHSDETHDLNTLLDQLRHKLHLH